ncbi:Protein of unknown function [Bacillus sp. 491mf]|uniref:DUF3975 family protein n=1 Tax=Bacillus TaxID=1386 RepID=UPI0005567C25|nr:MULTISPECIES: DUF3975 family protein [unclassified Bacillus (in: firmicutes)]SFC48406.1 Protein of unknown function [Bacillus sp. 491mf]
MWKKRSTQIMTGIVIAIAFLLQSIFHIAEWLFHKAFAILTFLPNMALEALSVIWSIIASIIVIIIWSIVKLWKKLFSKDSSSN